MLPATDIMAIVDGLIVNTAEKVSERGSAM